MRDRRNYMPWLVACAAATLLSLLIAWQNLPAMQQAGVPLGLWDLFLRELVIWYSWALLLPVLAWLTRTFPVAGTRRWRNLGMHVVVAPLLVFVAVMVFTGLRIALFGDAPRGAPLLDTVLAVYRRFFAFFLFVYAGSVAILQAWQQGIERHRHALEQAQLQTMLEQSRLENLRSQLDPHFLFNALNAISSLVAREPGRARQMIARLSGLLRMSLDQNGRDMVSLSQELELLGVYLEIQQLRFGDRLEVSLDIDDAVADAMLPRLLLQPLVENAVHHGLERDAKAGRIQVRLMEQASGKLRIEVLDDGPGFTESTNERVGLGNARARLALHFGDQASLDYGNRPEGGARVVVILPASSTGQGGS